MPPANHWHILILRLCRQPHPTHCPQQTLLHPRNCYRCHQTHVPPISRLLRHPPRQHNPLPRQHHGPQTSQRLLVPKCSPCPQPPRRSFLPWQKNRSRHPQHRHPPSRRHYENGPVICRRSGIWRPFPYHQRSNTPSHHSRGTRPPPTTDIRLSRQLYCRCPSQRHGHPTMLPRHRYAFLLDMRSRQPEPIPCVLGTFSPQSRRLLHQTSHTLPPPLNAQILRLHHC